MDYLDQTQAQFLADKIRFYWHSRGFIEVDVWIEGPMHLPKAVGECQDSYIVRSNIDLRAVSVRPHS